jgi:4-hydroxy-3-polyprenylbenzoate decarboxylase
MRILIGLTGASGHPVAVEFAKRCPAEEKYLVASRWGKAVLTSETGLTVEALAPHVKKVFSDDDLYAPFASGNTPLDALIVVPCSVSTVGKIAAGIGDTLLTRTAQVMLKERRKLILAIREAPLSSIALENCLKLSRDGALIVPLSPPFYTNPKTLDDIVRDMTDKLLSAVGYPSGKPWNEKEL